MKILVFMAHPGHLRNFRSTLSALAERGHELRIVVDTVHEKHVKDDRDLVQPFVAEFPNVVAERSPTARKTDWSEAARRLRITLDYLRYLDLPIDQADKVRGRASLRVPRHLRRVAESGPLSSGRGLKALQSTVALAESCVPVRLSVRAFLAERDPDVVLVTPLVELGSPQLEYVRAARRIRVPTALLVASWDNLTLKGGLYECPDLVTVWNRPQAEEAALLHSVPQERIAITGAPAYDQWFEWRSGRDRRTFCKGIGLDPSRPFLLYMGSSKFIAPEEASFVEGWAHAVREHGPPGVRDAQILVRPHPTNPLRQKKKAKTPVEGLVVYPPEGANPTNDEARADYYDSISHSAAVVGVNTSGMIEAAVLGRPVLTLLSERYRQTQVEMVHFQHLRQENGGMLHVAGSVAEHLEQLARALADPERAAAPNRAFVESFVRPCGIDRRATDVLVEEIERLETLVPAPGTSPALAARPVGLAMAGAALGVLRAGDRRNRTAKARGEAPALARSPRERHEKRARKREAGPPVGEAPGV